MADKIGRFEILSEIARSQSGCVYKASDPDSGQTVALKAIPLDLLKERAAELMERVLAEADTTKPLSSHNIALLYGAGDIEGYFCAAMEYVQGKSIANMLSRQEGFSVWDLQDIARQSCQGLDHAHARKVVHYSLEPGKILVSWDGTVKILGFGISAMGAWSAQASGIAPETLHYMSPEQLRGEPLDARSNLFSLGAILYEMVTGRKAFGAEDADQLRQEIMVGMPAAPAQIISKINPALSEVIMKALAKLPEQRYQSGQDLVNDLEQCKEGAAKASASKQAAPAPPKPAAGNLSAAEEAPAVFGKKVAAAAAAAGWSGSNSRLPEAAAPDGWDGAKQVSANLSAAWPTESETEVSPPPSNGDANPAGARRSRSFSDVDELPPLKAAYVSPIAPPEANPDPPEALHPPQATVFQEAEQAEKSRTPPKEMVRNAVKAIAKTPPKLFLYSLGAAVVIIVLVGGSIFYRNQSEKSQEMAVPAPAATPAVSSPPAPVAPESAPGEPPANVQMATPVEAGPSSSSERRAVISVAPKYSRHKAAKVVIPPVPVVVPGQLTVSSNPAGAQVLVDGHHNPGWVTPFDMTGLAPGQHLVGISKLGYAAETRTIQVASGSKSFLEIQLAALGATASISSVPPGAQVYMDGKDTGRITPAMVPVDRLGGHTFLVRKQGYLDETTTATVQAGQTFQFAPVLQALGNTDDIKMVGKFKKMFGGGETAGMGMVSVKTQPKGAQIAINRRILDKASPVEFYLNPGSYVIDITVSGHKSLHRLITVERGGKMAIDETLEPE
jgi:serine/threonine protein kinase